jgi:hypothetical protein
MTAYSTDTRTGDDRTDSRPARRATTETKAAFKTTEFACYLLAVLGVLVASAVVDENDNGQGFGAERAWLYVTMLTIGYLVSRGLAKAGSYDRGTDSRTTK